MNLLIAIHHFPPNFNGGAEWRAYRTALSLQRRGHRVQVVCIESITHGSVPGLNFLDDVFRGVNVRRLFFNLALAPDPFRWKYNNPWLSDHIRQMIEADKPDIFHLFSGYLMTGSVLNAAKQAGIVTVLSVTDFWFFCPYINFMRLDGHICEGQALNMQDRSVSCARCIGEEKRRFRYPGKIFPQLMDFYWRRQKKKIEQVEERMAYLKDTLSSVDVIVCPSNFLKNSYRDAGVDESQLVYARQGVDMAAMDPITLHLVHRPLRIGYIGQIAVHKGVHILLQAVRMLTGAPLQLSIYGDVTAFPAYVNRLLRDSKGDERVQLLGRYSRTEIHQVYNRLDILVMPSLWLENSPNVILEAFAYKIPVITANQGGMAELIQDGKNGFLFEVGNAADLAEKIQYLLDHPDLLTLMKMAIPAVKTVDDEMNELEGIYSEALDQNHLNHKNLFPDHRK